jgi:hypothetical protein
VAAAVHIAVDIAIHVSVHIAIDVPTDVTICDVDVSAVRNVPAAAVARMAASSASLNKQTVVQLRDGGPRSVDFDGFGLRRREAQ